MAWSKAKQSDYMRGYYARNRERILSANAEWRSRNKDLHLSRARAYHAENRETINARRRQERIDSPEIYRRRLLKRNYGLTIEDYDAMVAAQNSRCAICDRDRPLVVDHCHTTGQVRSLLCSPCNTALGLMEEDPDRVWAILSYLEKSGMIKAQAVVSKAGGPPPPAGAGQSPQPGE